MLIMLFCDKNKVNGIVAAHKMFCAHVGLRSRGLDLHHFFLGDESHTVLKKGRMGLGKQWSRVWVGERSGQVNNNLIV